MLDKARSRFNISAAEVDTQDVLQTLTLGVAVVSGEAAHAERSLDTVIRFMQGHTDAELVDEERD